MILLEATHLKYEIEGHSLIDVEHLQIHDNDRIGLVGRNGSGKTTLLELLTGIKVPHEGATIITKASTELLPQFKNTQTTKSGGEVTQAYINRSLAKKTDLLFADEPTTNLDTMHIEKLEKQLERWQGAIIIVSHDRAFLDNLCSTIWELDEGKITVYKGNYSDYASQKELEQRQQEKAYEQHEKKKRQLQKALVEKEQKAQQATKVPKSVSPSERRLLGAKTHFANIQKKLRKSASAIETRLEKLDEIQKIKELPPIKMSLPDEDSFKGRTVIRAMDFKGIIGKRILWKPTNFEIKGGDKIALIGNNGSGKTTLVKKVLNQDAGISTSPAMKVGYFSQNLDILDPNQSILENVRSTSHHDETLIRIVLARLRFFREDVYKRVDVLSGGERVKVAFAKLFVSHINTLILDEPTNFLDIEALEAFESLLQEYEGTILLVSHDRQFIQAIATKILAIKNQTIQLFDGTYEAYQQYVPQEKFSTNEERLLVLETKITEVLSKLSMEPSEELEIKFQNLLEEKRKISENE